MKILIALLAALLSPTTKADAIYLGGWSYHFANKQYVNNATHNMFALEANNWVVGAYTNSYSQDSSFIAKKFNIYAANNLQFNLIAGLIYGYPTCSLGGSTESTKKLTCPTLAPEVIYTKYRVQPVVFMPSPNAIALAVRISF